MKYKKSVKLTSLINDEYILLGAEAEGLFRRRERGVWIKRALVIAACLYLLTVGVAAILLAIAEKDVGVKGFSDPFGGVIVHQNRVKILF